MGPKSFEYNHIWEQNNASAVSALLPHWYPDTVKSNRCLHCNQKAPSPVFMPIVSFASALFLIYSTYAKPFLIRNKVDGGCSIPSRRLRHDLIHVSSWNRWMDGWESRVELRRGRLPSLWTWRILFGSIASTLGVE